MIQIMRKLADAKMRRYCRHIDAMMSGAMVSEARCLYVEGEDW
jgi:hypothetical protein